MPENIYKCDSYILSLGFMYQLYMIRGFVENQRVIRG
jgi:hypothetical protein